MCILQNPNAYSHSSTRPLLQLAISHSVVNKQLSFYSQLQFHIRSYGKVCNSKTTSCRFQSLRQLHFCLHSFVIGSEQTVLFSYTHNTVSKNSPSGEILHRVYLKPSVPVYVLFFRPFTLQPNASLHLLLCVGFYPLAKSLFFICLGNNI